MAQSNTLDRKPTHSTAFRLRRIINWFPMGLTYAFLYMARYNLTVSKTALGDLMSKSDFGIIFAAGTFTYALSFLINGPLTDKIGGKRAILIGAAGTALSNIFMGIIIWGILKHNWALNLVLAFSVLYALNMYFQSYGAVAIVKVNSAWFHVRERGIFGGIFGVLISLGLYFAFDWGEFIVASTRASAADLSTLQHVLRAVLGITSTSIDQTWWVFFIPAMVLALFFVIELFLLKDRPGQAGFEDFDTADASSGEENKAFNLKEILVKILTNPIILTIAFIEFCSGVLRNGIMHWYKIFSSDMGYVGDFFINQHWGLLLMLAGVFGGMFAGVISDKVFGSRRGPVAALLYGLMLIAVIGMWPFVVQSNKNIQKEITLQVKQPNAVETNILYTHAKTKLGAVYQLNETITLNEAGDSLAILKLTPLPGKEGEMTATSVGEMQLATQTRYNKFQKQEEVRQIKVKNIGEVFGLKSDHTAYILGLIVVFMSLCVIGVHGMLSGTSTMDFGGQRAAATAVGLIDGFVYLGTGVQSLALGFLTEQSWNYWPPFLIPFAIIGLILAIKIWYAFPNAKRKAR